MAQQTAVDWLVEKFNQCEPMYSGIMSNEHKKYLDGLIEQAKAMEKEQIVDSYIEGINEPYLEVTDDRHLFVKPDNIFNSAEQYYNETYGS